MDPSIQPIVAALRQRAAEHDLALHVEFWNGHRESTGAAPKVALELNRPEAAARLLRADLGSPLARAYVEGDIDLQGPSGLTARFDHRGLEP